MSETKTPIYKTKTGERLYTKQQLDDAVKNAVEGIKTKYFKEFTRQKNRNEQEIRCIISKEDSQTIDNLISRGYAKSRKIFFYNALVYYSIYVQNKYEQPEYTKTTEKIKLKKHFLLRIPCIILRTIKWIFKFFVKKIRLTLSKKRYKKKQNPLHYSPFDKEDLTMVSTNRQRNNEKK